MSAEICTRGQGKVSFSASRVITKADGCVQTPGVLAIWSAIESENLAAFRLWHNREHLPERLEVSGFVEALRYHSLDRIGAFLTLYVLEQIEVLDGNDYQALLLRPSESTVAMVRGKARAIARAACRVVASFAHARGGLVAVWRIDEAQPQGLEAALNSWRAMLTAAAQDPAVAAGDLFAAREAVADIAATAALLGDIPSPRLTVIVEFCTDEANARAVCDRLAAMVPIHAAPEMYSLEVVMSGRTARMKQI